mgnify:CR=1 FL=1
MDYKKINAPLTTITRDVEKLYNATGNIYEAVVIIGKRANQISVEMKQELNKKLEEFVTVADNLEEVFENREQIEISKYYERLPKPVLIALQEFEESKIFYRNPEKAAKTKNI